MTFVRPLYLSCSLAIAALGTSSCAALDNQHQTHHPAGAASAAVPKAMSGESSVDMSRMDAQIKTMGDMHARMMAAKSPEERNALMAEHMQVMQKSMSMMNGMSSGGMGGMGGMKGDLAACHQMMEKRMEMMQTMMQMMMDRLPAAPMK